MIIDEKFFQNKTPFKIAKDLLGVEIIHKTKEGIISGYINEVEIYLENDEASHSFKGKITKRNEVMFKKAGHLYVYFTYGMYHCINIVIGNENKGEAILIRSIIPNKGLNLMIKNRYGKNKNINNISKSQLKNLCNGPAKLAIALNLDKNYNGINLLDKKSKIYLNKTNLIPKKIIKTTRIGISKSKDKKWRFLVEKFNKEL
jgi:DNA-3-methyladenine glycosylase